MAANKKINPAKLVAERMLALERSMQSLDIGNKNRREIAFAIAEISEEMEFLLELVNRAKRNKSITNKDLEKINGIVTFHWPIHLRDLTKALARAFKEIERQETK
jgi:hypothetical protein